MRASGEPLRAIASHLGVGLGTLSRALQANDDRA
jgi:hypothetical protein